MDPYVVDLTYNRIFIEPVGAKSPTFASDVKFSGIDRKNGHSLSLLCPAQGYPAPNYR